MSKIFKLGVIGNPIEHSLSPFIHSRFARKEGLNLDYKAYRVEQGDFNDFISEFFSDKYAKGLNVTLPLKNLAATNIKGNISNEAKFINAVNTISNFFWNQLMVQALLMTCIKNLSTLKEKKY